MRLVTFEYNGRTRLGTEWNDRILDLQNAYLVWEIAQADRERADAVAKAQSLLPSDMVAFLAAGDAARAAAREAIGFVESMKPDALARSSGLVHARDAVTLKAPVPRPPKVICLGLNYRDHAAESGVAVPTEPVVFSKYASSVIGPGETIVLPPTSKEIDYEAELVFVMGRGGRNISESAAMEYVAGYTCGHDVSARDYQMRRGGGQWMIGKSFDTFAPIGPALVTRDEVADPHALGIRCVVNGETLQNSNTSQMVFSIPQTIAYLSHVMTLEPGDVVFTGTPPGVGFARKPPIFLKDGDVVEIQIEGLGSLRNPVRAG
jgi:2-keto-4-pentenoate hydratase/2-oxohepta-3-ene-1,7-dioic acid hydratase in catechol pathway